jgi:hypothetical protein
VLVWDLTLVGKWAVIAGPRPLAAGTVVRPFAEGSEGAPRLAAGDR